MLKRSITYTNPFNDQEVTEEHFFHISKADLVEMEIEEHGDSYVQADGTELTGMQAKLQRIIDLEDGKAIMREFKDIIRRSYGKKEGDRFIKTDEVWRDFAGSEAFSQLLFELCTQADASAEFINGVVPANLDQIAKEVQDRAQTVAAGREAQATAKAVGSGHPSDPAATPVEAASPPEGDVPARNDFPQATLAERIEAATAENPITLTQAEVVAIDSDELKSGLATGRIKLPASA